MIWSARCKFRFRDLNVFLSHIFVLYRYLYPNPWTKYIPVAGRVLYFVITTIPMKPWSWDTRNNTTGLPPLNIWCVFYSFKSSALPGPRGFCLSPRHRVWRYWKRKIVTVFFCFVHFMLNLLLLWCLKCCTQKMDKIYLQVFFVRLSDLFFLFHKVDKRSRPTLVLDPFVSTLHCFLFCFSFFTWSWLT